MEFFHKCDQKKTLTEKLLYFLEEERGQKRKRELDEEGEEDEDD